MMTQLNSQLSFFFRSPHDAPKKNVTENLSNLYLLRRDILCYYGFDPTTGLQLEPKYQALWPGVMAIMAGIDLLGKFSEGDSVGVGARFKAYVRKYIDDNLVDELYQLRCSLIHSFGLYSEANNLIYRFFLGGQQSNGKLIQLYNNGHYGVDIYLLRNLFEQSITKFHQTILSDGYPKARFTSMIEKYGGIRIGSTESFT